MSREPFGLRRRTQLAASDVCHQRPASPTDVTWDRRKRQAELHSKFNCSRKLSASVGREQLVEVGAFYFRRQLPEWMFIFDVTSATEPEQRSLTGNGVSTRKGIDCAPCGRLRLMSVAATIGPGKLSNYPFQNKLAIIHVISGRAKRTAVSIQRYVS